MLEDDENILRKTHLNSAVYIFSSFVDDSRTLSYVHTREAATTSHAKTKNVNNENFPELFLLPLSLSPPHHISDGGKPMIMKETRTI